MRAVVQRVSRARVTPGGAIGAGLCVLLGVADGDDAAAAERLAGKVARLRIFEGDDGKFDRSLLDTGGAALVVSQFTLIADTQQGQPAELLRRGAARAWPSRSTSASARRSASSASTVETGVFGARMQVELVNDGPVTIVLDVTRETLKGRCYPCTTFRQSKWARGAHFCVSSSAMQSARCTASMMGTRRTVL